METAIKHSVLARVDSARINHTIQLRNMLWVANDTHTSRDIRRTTRRNTEFYGASNGFSSSIYYHHNQHPGFEGEIH